MARGKVAVYDDEALVEMLAGGNHTYVQIAEELGLTETYVGKVARGERRPELQERLGRMRRGMLDQARRLGARYSRALLHQHIKEGLAGKSETARKCREFTLKACCFGREATGKSLASERYAWSQMLDALLPLPRVDPPPADPEEEDRPWAGETPKGSYPLESPPTDEDEAENDPGPPESEVEGEQAVAADEAPAKGCVKDRGTPEGQIRTYAL